MGKSTPAAMKTLAVQFTRGAGAIYHYPNVEPEKVVELASAVLRRNPQTPVLVNADQRVAYREVVAAMVLLKEAGAKNVGFLTEPPTKSRRRG